MREAQIKFKFKGAVRRMTGLEGWLAPARPAASVQGRKKTIERGHATLPNLSFFPIDPVKQFHASSISVTYNASIITFHESLLSGIGLFFKTRF